MYRKFSSLLVGILISILSLDSLAQVNYANQNWYFGNSIYGIRFNRPTQAPDLDDTNMTTLPFGRFGNATASEPETGNLLFYTDGSNVYDGNYALMPSGTGLDADINRNQGIAITSVPGNNDRYLIFTNTVGNEIHVSLVDAISAGNAVVPQPPLGDVLSSNQPIGVSSNNASAILAIAKADLSGYWLISSGADPLDSAYYVLDIDGANPGTWTETPYAFGLPITASHLTFSKNTGKLAVAPQSNNINVQILNFNDTTGVLSYDQEVLNSGFSDIIGESVYDTEWSPDGSKLYISRYGGNAGVGDVLQWDSNGPPSASLQSVLPSPVYGSYGLKVGPDNRIYHIYQEFGVGPFLVGRIGQADSVASLTNYIPTVFAQEDFNGQQFPATLPPRELQMTVDFTVAGTCANVATSFYPQIDPPADTVFWDFGDGGGSALLSPVYTYQAGGTYTVSMLARLNGQDTIVSKPITITDFDLQLTLPADTVACQCELPKYGTPTPCTQFSVTVQAQSQSGIVPTYLWSNGQTGETLMPDSAGYYYVVATDPVSGCSNYAGVTVQEYGFQDSRSNVWYFGQNAGIDFNPPFTQALDDGIMDAPEGCTAVSDRNGQILFYTDGDKVYVKDEATGTHLEVDSGIGGSPGSSQSVISVPFANDETLFYIFTTQEVGTGLEYAFKYSVFDIKANSGQGGIIEKDITLFTKSTERITATANWVVIHEYGNNNFRAYRIQPDGLSNPVVSSLGSIHFTTPAPEATAQGYMKIEGDKLAVALSESPSGPSYVELFDWDEATGRVVNYEQIDVISDISTPGQVYGVAFSPGGNKLYATVQLQGGGSTLVEYRADSLDRINFITQQPVGDLLGAIQRAPDGQLYVAVEGSSNLGVIQVNEDTVLNSVYNPTGFALAGGTSSRLGLPNFSSSFGSAIQVPGILVSNPVCVGQQINLAASTTSSIDTVSWQITDAMSQVVFTSQNLSDSLVLNTPGNYLVSLRMGNRCGLDSAFSETITVNPPPQNSTLPAGLPICGASTVIDPYDIDPPDVAEYDFLWSTGETTRTIVVSAQGPYSVVMTNRNSGCTNTASVFVGPPFPVDLGPDQTVCEADPLILDSQANASTYGWFINNIPVINNQRTLDFGAQALTGGVYNVRVEVVDPVDPSCVVIDSAIITVNAAPQIAPPAITSATCGNSDGAIDFTISNAGSGSYIFDLSGPVNLINQPIVGGVGTATSLPAGVYLITVRNVTSGCVGTLGGIIVDNAPPAFNILSAAELFPNGCDPANPSGQLRIQIDNPAAFPIDFILYDESDNSVAATGTNVANNGADDFIIGNLPDGTYSIELDPTGCPVFQNGILLSPTPIVDLQVNNSVSDCNTTDLSSYVSSSSAGVILEWSYDGLTYNDIAVPVDPATDGVNFGTIDIYIRATAAGFCTDSTLIPVTLVPTPTISQIDQDISQICEGFVTLTAVADGGYTGAQLQYRWLPTGETTPTIIATQDGITHTVSVNNALNQSCFSQDQVQVQIPQPFTVSISSTLACDDDQPFTLTAAATNANVDYAWTLNGNSIPGNAILTTTAAGLYEVVATDNINPGSCSATASLNVVKAPVTPTDLSSALVFCPDEGGVTLDAGNAFISYQWSTGETTQSIDVNAAGVYSVNATNNFGCVTNDQSEVLEDCIPKVFGPNAFRPGGLNNEFYLFTQYLDKFDIFIYSRWGELVYHSDQKDFRWNGNYEGQLLPAGQYTWVVRYTSSFRDRGVLEQYGGVTLLR